MSSIYSHWRFSDDPFAPRPLGPDRIGSCLFVGRDAELRQVDIRLRAGDAAIAIDGPVGVGKTSLANIAAYRAQKIYLDSPKTSQLLFPCKASFQISNEESPDAFRFRVLTEVAQTLLEKASELRIGLEMDGRGAVDAWLNSPLMKQWNLGIPVASAGYGSQPNGGAGYVGSGFEKTVTDWLSQIFPHSTDGGVVCVLDNLELLETSAVARKTIEVLRDTLFSIKVLRWILCGAHGILHGVVASPRLVGHIRDPVQVIPLTLKTANEVFDARVSTFSVDGRAPYLPLESDDFHRLYMIVGKNLRNALAYTNDYCIDVMESGTEPTNSEQKKERLDAWMKRSASRIGVAMRSALGPTASELFFKIASDTRGEVAPGDFSQMGFKSIQAMRPHVRDLEQVGLLASQYDEGDHRRKSIAVTGKGWLFHWWLIQQ